MLIVMDMLLERERMAYWAKVLSRSLPGSADLSCEKEAQTQVPTPQDPEGDLIAGRLRSIVLEVDALLKIIEKNDTVTYVDLDTHLKKVILSVNLLRRGIQEMGYLFRVEEGVKERRFA
jgi:hypothetical protein